MVTFHYEVRRLEIRSWSCRGEATARRSCSSSCVSVFECLSVPVPVFLCFSFLCFLLSVCFTWIWGRPPQWELLGPIGPVAKTPRSAWSCFGHHIKWPFLDFYSRSLDFYLNMEYMLLRAFSLSSQHFINAILCSSPFSFVEQKTSCFAHHRYQVLLAHAYRPDTHAIHLIVGIIESRDAKSKRQALSK